MNSITNEINNLRHNSALTFDSSNKNRYCIIVQENNSQKTAYCFGVPIYNSASRKLLDLTFKKQNNRWTHEGSNAIISIGNYINLKDQNNVFKIDLSDLIINGTDKVLYGKHSELYPTLNGIAAKMLVDTDKKARIHLTTQTPFLRLWINDRCFALMKSDYEPLITISCIGALNNKGTHITPCKLSYKKIDDKEYIVEFIGLGMNISSVLFEINLYEKKLFQDTTVETKNPNMNNAYGGTAYIGNTDTFGEQWLYTRIDYSLITDFLNCKINRVLWHFPKICPNETILNAHMVSGRFCSFGSNWDNKIPAKNVISDFFQTEKYQSIDITNHIVDKKTKYLSTTNGLIITAKNNSYSTISTGDSFYAPQILEISYK